MKLEEVMQQAGKAKRRKRVGRGIGSGMGKTSGRGHKGYGSRAGSTSLFGYEGGQTPTLSRIPKRGFNNANFRTVYQTVNVSSLEQRFEADQRVDAEALAAARLIQDAGKPVKVLGNGELKKKLTVVAAKFSKSAAEKITQAGGTVEQA